MADCSLHRADTEVTLSASPQQWAKECLMDKPNGWIKTYTAFPCGHESGRRKKWHINKAWAINRVIYIFMFLLLHSECSLTNELILSSWVHDNVKSVVFYSFRKWSESQNFPFDVGIDVSRQISWQTLVTIGHFWVHTEMNPFSGNMGKVQGGFFSPLIGDNFMSRNMSASYFKNSCTMAKSAFMKTRPFKGFWLT